MGFIILRMETALFVVFVMTKIKNLLELLLFNPLLIVLGIINVKTVMPFLDNHHLLIEGFYPIAIVKKK